LTDASQDAELLKRAAAGDEPAAGELFDRHAPRLMRFLAMMLGDAAAAEDAVQSSFAYLFSHAAAYDPEKAGVGTWLMRIGRSYAKNELRRRGRRPFLSLDSPVPCGGDETASLSEVIAADRPGFSREEVELALKALSELPRKEREAVVMRFVHGMEPREIASALGLAPKAVSMRIWRALNRLRAVVGLGPESA
jgi:RNA polymerase sigma-70 factor (ECF subfamily)